MATWGRCPSVSKARRCSRPCRVCSFDHKGKDASKPISSTATILCWLVVRASVNTGLRDVSVHSPFLTRTPNNTATYSSTREQFPFPCAIHKNRFPYPSQACANQLPVSYLDSRYLGITGALGLASRLLAIARQPDIFPPGQQLIQSAAKPGLMASLSVSVEADASRTVCGRCCLALVYRRTLNPLSAGFGSHHRPACQLGSVKSPCFFGSRSLHAEIEASAPRR